MEEFWRELPPSEERQEVVLTYRQGEDIEPVTLRYERPLPECMRFRPEEKAPASPARRADSPLNPPEKPRARWGVRLYVGLSLLTILLCLGVGVWYVTQYGLTLPGSRAPDRPDGQEGLPPPGEYYWNMEVPENTAITIPSYPVGGDAQLTLISAGSLPQLTPKEVYDHVTPSVVTVLGQQRLYSAMASVGTGIIFSEDGYILTNCHVIAGCSSCLVWITDAHGIDAEYEAKVVGYDEDADLAVLKVEAEGLPAAEFGVSDDLQVGDPVYAIGNPLGLELRNTLTDGIVSAINRDVDVDGVIMTLIQTTAALNSGNSGGPLINQYGQVIGINTIKMMSEYDTIEGLGFAIPSSLALRWVNELIEFGELLPQPVLGVTINRIPETLPDGTLGLRVESVSSGLSGEAAGLQVGDYIVSFDGQAVSSTEQILVIRRGLYVGDEVEMRIFRGGEYLELVMTMMAE